MIKSAGTFVQDRVPWSSTWARAVALLEQNDLALCVGLALDMHLVFECAALQLRGDLPTLFQGMHTMRCFMWQDNLVLMPKFVRDAVSLMRAASSGNELDV